MPTTFIFGHLVMLLCQDSIEPNKFWTKPMKFCVGYVLLIFIPVTGWFFYNHNAWSTVYLWAPEKQPVLLGPVFFFTYFMGMMLGAALSQSYIQAGKPKHAVFTLVLGFVWFLGMAVVTADQYAHVGNYLEYHSGTAISLFQNPGFMNLLNAMGAVLGIPLILIVVYLRKSRA